MNTEDIQKAKETINYHKKQRRHLALEIRRARHNFLRYKRKYPDFHVNELIRKLFTRELNQVPFKPSAKNFHAAACKSLQFADSEIPQREAECYSCCEIENSHRYKRNIARRLAEEYFRAEKYLLENK
jgi:hypothetical protein